MEDDERSVSKIEACIHDYLAENPDAADTVDGIAVWWLSPAVSDATPERIERALDRLIRARELVPSELPDGTVLYRRR